MYVLQFYNLISYKKCMNLVADVVEEITAYEAFKIKICLVKIMKHIAHSQAVSIYSKSKQYQFKEALKWIYRAEKEVKVLNISELKKKQYAKELNEIRKLLIVLNKKNQMEDNKND